MRNTLQSRKVKTQEKTQVYQAIVCSILLYGAECWCLRVDLLHKLEVFHNLCIRRMCNISRKVQRKKRISSAELRKRMNINSIEELITTRMMRWAGHVARMDWLKRTPRILLTGWVENRRPIGRPQTTFGHALKRCLRFRADQSTGSTESIRKRK